MENKHELETLRTPPAQSERNFEQQNFFRCCSGSDVDRRMLVFLVCAALTFLTALFSMFMLYNVDKCDNEVYVSLLTASISFWMRPPSSGRNNM